MDPQEGGSKNKTVDRAVSKNAPLARLLTLPFGDIKKSGEKCCFPIFAFSIFGPFFCFWSCSPPKNYPPNFCHAFRVAQKTGENKGFCGVVPRVFKFYLLYFVLYFFHVVSLCSCFPSCTFIVANVWSVLAVLLVPFVFFLFSVMFVFFFFGGGGYSSFDVNHFNGPVPMTKQQDQTTENPNMWNFIFDVLLWGPYRHTFTWPT